MVVGSPGAQQSPPSARVRSAADSRGANWANAAARRRASPITRPIKVQVMRDQLTVLAAESGVEATVVHFEQPVDRVLDDLAAAVGRHVQDWGLAGDGMYWRPMLSLSVARGAERQAARIVELLQDSGLDVRLPQTALRPQEGGGRATR
jgi:hypothetical protein